MKYFKIVFAFFIFSTTTGFGQSMVIPNASKDSVSMKWPLNQAEISFFQIDYKLLKASGKNVSNNDEAEQWKAGWKNNPLSYYGETSFGTSPSGSRQFKVPYYYIWVRQYDYTLLKY